MHVLNGRGACRAFLASISAKDKDGGRAAAVFGIARVARVVSLSLSQAVLSFTRAILPTITR
jgi:hypothetical protein